MSSHDKDTIVSTTPLLKPEEAPVELSGAPVQSTMDATVDAPSMHVAIIGPELTEKAANKVATITTLGDTPFEDDGEEVEQHGVVATEIVPNPIALHAPEPILQNSVILLMPRIAETLQLLESAKKRGVFVTAVNTQVNDGSKPINWFPTAEALLEIGVHQVYEPPTNAKFSVVECANHLKTIESQQNLRFLGILPLQERAVDYSDLLGALLGLKVHNDLGLATARRDKALMKLAVSNAGLRVAKYARLTAPDGSDVERAIADLELDFPVVIKTPRGMSTQDVYICETMEEAVEKSGQIVRSVGPDGTKASFSLLEEFLSGDEFAVNLISSPTMVRGVQVTDIWQYDKIITDGSNVNRMQIMVDPHDSKYAALVRYAEGVCRAVGIQYGLGHCEIMSVYNPDKKRYVDPVMIEIGARLPGGRKSIMVQQAVPAWHPFDAMMDAHCGFPVRVPPTFTPAKVACQVFVPSTKTGILRAYRGADFERLATHNQHVVLAQVGQPIRRATDIMSFAAFVWLIGDREQVKKDAEEARAGFEVDVDPISD